jgi:ribose transport system permease protein
MPRVLALLRGHTWAFAVALTVALIVANIILLPAFASPHNWPETLATFAPFALVAMASTPSIVSGGGGIDISIGPLATLINVVFVFMLLPHGLGSAEISIPLLLALGTSIGAITGALVGVLRYPPVIASLGMLFAIEGAALAIAPNASAAPSNWTSHLVGSIGPVPWGVVLVAIPLLVWAGLKRTAFHRTLYFVGGDDVTAYSAGVNVALTRLVAYAIGGLFAAIAGIALTAVIQSGDATLAEQYTLIALAAVSIGGTPFGGGIGGLTGSVAGAAAIYMIQNVLSAVNVSGLWVNVIYGIMLMCGVLLSALIKAPRIRAVAA